VIQQGVDKEAGRPGEIFENLLEGQGTHGATPAVAVKRVVDHAAGTSRRRPIVISSLCCRAWARS
jgi:hypothetical protein